MVVSNKHVAACQGKQEIHHECSFHEINSTDSIIVFKCSPSKFVLKNKTKTGRWKPSHCLLKEQLGQDRHGSLIGKSPSDQERFCQDESSVSINCIFVSAQHVGPQPNVA